MLGIHLILIVGGIERRNVEGKTPRLADLNEVIGIYGVCRFVDFVLAGQHSKTEQSYDSFKGGTILFYTGQLCNRD
ncbi:MAG: hypothetical protein CL930_07360 [Deltaproteobacteria bacterium]|nr:hypothetical protein [Deltaproteobacteria bacterium]